MSKIITHLYRGKIIESTHRVKCLIQKINGEKIYSTNNENDYIFPRSSIKVFQAIPFAYSKAIEYGSHAIELDARMSSDDVIFIYHDENFLRTANKDIIFEKTQSKYIHNLRLNNGEKIPTLEGVLETFGSKVEFIIEEPFLLIFVIKASVLPPI